MPTPREKVEGIDLPRGGGQDQQVVDDSLARLHRRLSPGWSAQPVKRFTRPANRAQDEDTSPRRGRKPSARAKLFPPRPPSADRDAGHGLRS